MNITVLEELQANIDPLSHDEHAALERSILAERRAQIIAATASEDDAAPISPRPHA